MPRTDVTLQINSLAAINRLLGEDSNMSIEVRRAVIEQFAKGFVKNVVNAEALRDEARRIQESANAEARRIVLEAVGASEEGTASQGRDGLWKRGTKIELGDDLVDAIKATARKEVRLVIHEAVSALVTEDIVQQTARSYVEAYARTAIRNYVESEAITLIKDALRVSLVAPAQE